MNAYDSPEARANVAAIEAKLVELDPMFLQFCSRHGYRFSPTVELWPRRRVSRRQEIDRCMDLTMEVGVQEVLDRGFHPDLQWSLYTSGSLPLDPELHILSRPVFEHLSYSRFLPILADSLERGLEMLNRMNEDEIHRHGKKWRNGAEPGASPNAAPPHR
jgi:hypothetical protein